MFCLKEVSLEELKNPPDDEVGPKNWNHVISFLATTLQPISRWPLMKRKPPSCIGLQAPGWSVLKESGELIPGRPEGAHYLKNDTFWGVAQAISEVLPQGR